MSRGCASVLGDFGLVLCEVLKKNIFLIFFSFCLLWAPLSGKDVAEELKFAILGLQNQEGVLVRLASVFRKKVSFS